MAPEEMGFFEWAFKASVVGLFSLGARLWMQLFARVRETEENLKDYKLEVSEKYVKKSDLDEIKATLTEVRQDIKTLLVNKQ